MDHDTKVPLQFSISTLLVVTALYAILFSILRIVNASPLVCLVMVLLFTAVGFGQKFLFHGQRPRRASMIVGACFYLGFHVIECVQYGVTPIILCGSIAYTIFGAMLGYWAGSIVEGTFFVIGKLEGLHKNRQSDE